MSKKDNIILITSALFTTVAILHILRVVLGTSLSIGGVEISTWISVMAFFGAGILAILNFQMIEKITKNHWLRFFMWIFVIDGLGCFYSWAGGLTYWGFSNQAFGWIFAFDVLMVILFFFLSKGASKKSISSSYSDTGNPSI